MEDQNYRQSPEQSKRAREEYAIVLDFLPLGYPFDKRPSHKKTPVVQAIGKTGFVLLQRIIICISFL